MTQATSPAIVAGAVPRGKMARLRQLLSMPTAIAGIAILVVFAAFALCAPLFIHPSDLNVTQVNGPTLAAPSAHYPLGTDRRAARCCGSSSGEPGRRFRSGSSPLH